jgi:bifunctional non-homologous end joining protein LigD
MYLNGHDMRKAPLVVRKAALAALLKGSNILMSQSFETDGVHMFQTACAMGLEGVVSKRKASRYQSGRTNDWLKLTCRQRETLQIVGFRSSGTR